MTIVNSLKQQFIRLLIQLRIVNSLKQMANMRYINS